jgi:hypothetical protein
MDFMKQQYLLYVAIDPELILYCMMLSNYDRNTHMQ